MKKKEENEKLKSSLTEGIDVGEQFGRYRKRMLRAHVLKSLLIGLGAGLLGAAVVIVVVAFLDQISLAYWLAPAVGGGVWLITSLVYGFLKKPTDKEIALWMDKDMGLKEKTATMIEYRKEDSLLIDAQRNDADASLEKKPTKGVKLRLASVTLPLLLLSGAVFTTSCFTPTFIDIYNANHPSEQDQEEANDYTHLIITGMEDTILNSDASEAFKEKLIALLEQLEKDLTDVVDVSKRREIVDQAKAKVLVALDEVNSKEEIGKALRKTDVTYFQTIGEGLMTSDEDTGNETINQGFKDWMDYLENTESDDDFFNLVAGYADTLEAAMAAAKEDGVPETDELYKIFLDLVEDLRNEVSVYNDENSDYAVEDLRADVLEDIFNAERRITSDEGDYHTQMANDSLAADILDYMEQLVDPSEGEGSDGEDGEGSGSGEESGDQSGSGSGEGSGSDSGDSSGSGDSGSGEGSGSDSASGSDSGNNSGSGSDGSGAGSGSGGQEYPYDDSVYTGDGEDGTEYGDVIDDYFNDAQNDANGTGDDELNDAVDDYFNELYGGDDGNP